METEDKEKGDSKDEIEEVNVKGDLIILKREKK